MLLRPGNHQGGNGIQGAALGFKPGALPVGVTLRPAECCEGSDWGLAAFWVHHPPCYLVTLARGGREAHEALLDTMLTAGADAGADERDGANSGGSGSSRSSPAFASSPPSRAGFFSPRNTARSPNSPRVAARSPRTGVYSPRAVRSPRLAAQAAQGAAASSVAVAIAAIAREPLLQQEEWPAGALATDAIVGYAQAAVERSIQEGQCTFAATGASWMPQPYYVCRTCRELHSTNSANVGCCLPCAAVCHQGHDLEARPAARFYCDWCVAWRGVAWGEAFKGGLDRVMPNGTKSCRRSAFSPSTPSLPTTTTNTNSGLGNYAGLSCQCMSGGAGLGLSFEDKRHGEEEWLPGLGDENDSRDRMPPLILVSAMPPTLGNGGHPQAHAHGHHCDRC